MSPLSSRDRVITALNHDEPDRVPADLGGSQNSTIHIEAYVRLLKYLGIEPQKPPSIRKVAQTVNEIEPILLDRLHVDCVGITPGAPDHSRDMDLPNGDWQDEFGVVRRRTPSSKTYDLHRSPLSGQIDIEDVEAFAWPDPDDPGYRRGLNEKARFLYQHTDRALVGYLLYNIIHMAQYLRGFDNWFCTAPGSLDTRLMFTRLPEAPPRARLPGFGQGSGSRSSRRATARCRSPRKSRLRPAPRRPCGRFARKWPALSECG